MILRQTNLFGLAAIIGICLGFAGSVGAIDQRLESGGFGFKVGLISSATYSIDSLISAEDDDIDATTKIGLSAGTFFNIPLMSRVALCTSADFHDINVMGHRQWMLDVGVGIKTAFQAEDSPVALRPGFKIGYGYLAAFPAFEKTTWLTWKVQTEIVFLVDRKYSYVIEVAVVGFENGESDDVTINTHPVISARFGIIY